MLKKLFSTLVCFGFFASPVFADSLEGNYLYRVTTVRAALGELEQLLNWYQALKQSDYYQSAGLTAPFVIRHSQGDQWDLMIVSPMDSWQTFYLDRAIKKRATAQAQYQDQLAEYGELIAFEEDHFAYGPDLEHFETAFEDNSFVHIEMFKAAPGKAQALLRQRQMENNYLEATQQRPNMIFVRAAGSDVDVFTIGFHPSLEAFAAPAPVTVEQKEKAARDAGFKSLADLSFYLRSLISSHHDTLANKVE